MYFWKENFIVDVWKDTFLFTILIYSDQSIFFKDLMCNSYYFNGGGGAVSGAQLGRERGGLSCPISKKCPDFAKNALIVSMFEF